MPQARVTAARIKPLRRASEDAQAAKELEGQFRRLLATRTRFYLSLGDLQPILRWKLRGQYGRQSEIREENTDAIVRLLTRAAFAIRHRDWAREAELRVKVLCALRGVGVPVASAILAIVEPRKYGVVDFRAWRQVFGEKKVAFTVGDYTRYLGELRRLARELRWGVRDVDEAIWELDRRRNGRT